MNRQLVLATLALATLAASGCGSSGPESAGEKVGRNIGALQTTVMVKTAQERLEGIEKQLKAIKGDVPEETYKQLEDAEFALRNAVTAATNHPEGLDKASTDALAAFTAVSGNGDVSDFVKGVRKGYGDALGQ